MVRLVLVSTSTEPANVVGKQISNSPTLLNAYVVCVKIFSWYCILFEQGLVEQSVYE